MRLSFFLPNHDRTSVDLLLCKNCPGWNNFSCHQFVTIYQCGNIFGFGAMMTCYECQNDIITRAGIAFLNSGSAFHSNISKS